MKKFFIQTATLTAIAGLIALAAWTYASQHQDVTTKGYGQGNMDGYVAGYNDALKGTPPDPMRSLTNEDHPLRRILATPQTGDRRQ